MNHVSDECIEAMRSELVLLGYELDVGENKENDEKWARAVNASNGLQLKCTGPSQLFSLASAFAGFIAEHADMSMQPD